jgi:hypothetical protein
LGAGQVARPRGWEFGGGSVECQYLVIDTLLNFKTSALPLELLEQKLQPPSLKIPPPDLQPPHQLLHVHQAVPAVAVALDFPPKVPGTTSPFTMTRTRVLFGPSYDRLIASGGHLGSRNEVDPTRLLASITEHDRTL